MFQLSETQYNECYSCWCTMDSCSRVLKIFLEFSVSLHSRFSFLPLLNASIEGNVKKTAVERTREWSVVLWKISLRTPLGQKGKQLHFTQAQLNRNKDFCGSGFGFFQSVRCRFLRTRVTKAQNDISVKSKYRVRSIRLSFENFIFDFDNAPYFKMAWNFVIRLSL